MGCIGTIGGSLWSVLTFVLFVVGVINEILKDWKLHNDLKSPDYDDVRIDTELSWLHAINLMYIIFLALYAPYILCCVGCAACNSASDHKEKHKIAKYLGVTISYTQFSIVILGLWKIIVYASILNKLREAKRWNGSDDWDFFAYAIPFYRSFPKNINEQLKLIIELTAFNLFRFVIRIL
jgi:hypothetical protein